MKAGGKDLKKLTTIISVTAMMCAVMAALIFSIWLAVYGDSNYRFYKKEYGTESLSERAFAGSGRGGYSDPDYWIWCGSVVQGEDGAYHMFASRWPKDLGFGANWLFNCEIVRASSKNPEGPYTFQEVVLGRRGRTFLTA